MMRKFMMGAVVSLTIAMGAALGLANPAGAATRAYSDCRSGNICFYTEANGGGSVCQWSGNDDDWTAGATKCSWADTSIVRSVYNNGTSTSYVGVAYYASSGYVSRMGCTRRGVSGNLSGTYKLRSHKWLASGNTCG